MRLSTVYTGKEAVRVSRSSRKYGGRVLSSSGAYHLGLPTMIEDRQQNATSLIAELVAAYDPEPVANVAAPVTRRCTPRISRKRPAVQA